MMLRTNTILCFVGCIFFSVFIPVAEAQCNINTATPKFRKAIFDFTTNIISSVAEEEENHFVFSPLSLWTMLAVTAEGASGETFEEMRRTLRLSKIPCFQSKYYQLVKYLAEKTDEVTFQRSGLIAIDRSVRLKEDYLRKVKSELQVAEVQTLDFNDKYGTARYVNDYIMAQSNGNIEALVEPDEFTDVSILLLDSVYFKASWNVPFNADETVPSVFFDDDQMETGKVNMMHVSGQFYLTEIPSINAKVLELPYGSDDRFAMLVFLPKDGVRLTNVIDDLELMTLNAIYYRFKQTGPSNVDVYLPRFKLETKLGNLKEQLQNFGLKSVFESTADLGKMSEDPYYLGAVTQKAAIEVTEKGTVASAATSGFFHARTMPELFQANKPFLYLIIEKYTHTVIFCGAYSKVTTE